MPESKQPAKTAYQKMIEKIVRIHRKSGEQAMTALDQIRVRAYWEIGRLIIKEEKTAAHGDGLIEKMSQDLTVRLGKGFSRRNLFSMKSFYLTFPKVQNSALLTWSHYQILCRIEDPKLREHYREKAVLNRWNMPLLKANLIEDKVILSADEEEEQAKLTAPPKSRKLTVTRGKLFAYRVSRQEKMLWRRNIPFPVLEFMTDCGFEMFYDVPLLGIRFPKDGEIIESLKTDDGYTFRRSEIVRREIYTFKALVEKVIDGDTLICSMDLGFGVWSSQRLRLRNIDCPEIRTQKGQAAQKFVEDLLKDLKFVVIKTYQTDVHGRYRADVFYLPGQDDPRMVAAEGILLNQTLLDEGLAERY